jgi:predicted RNA-binding protein with PIN domain
VIIVFDAYRVKDGKGSMEKYGDVTVVYTKERETADSYIERATYNIAPTNQVRVVTSDLEEQYIVLGNGALRVSPNEWRRELDSMAIELGEYIEKYSRRQ